jgi:hypothetical protein
MRQLPDPDLSFRDAVNYIFDCALCRRALADPQPKDLALFVRDAAQLIHRLTVSCHLPEFTDHGIAHLCSLLERISTWTSDDPPGSPQLLVDRLSADECATLLIAVLFHDIGMLSQRPDDLPQPVPIWAVKALNDVPNWVRLTHILRMHGVVRRGLGNRAGTRPADAAIQRALAVAAAHGSWPRQREFTTLSPRDGALAAVLAVADLLDEDANRCDITTLLNHRQGSQLNRAHWIRHGLTIGRVKVVSDEIQIDLASVPGADPLIMAPVFCALRNHFRLALMYRSALAPIKANNLRPKFNAPTGVPPTANQGLAGWNLMPSFATAPALSFQLMNTFFPVSLLDAEKATTEEMADAAPLLEPVDLTSFRLIRGSDEPRSSYEQVARALSL